MSGKPMARTHQLADLPALLRAVNTARDQLTEQRAERRTPNEQSAARMALLDALEAYANALEATHRPVPYALRDELRLRRALVTSFYSR